MYTLYYSPGACSMAVHVILNEIGAPVKLESASTKEGKNRTPEFLKINPLGQVPVLAEGNNVMREGGAIIVYLCDKHKSNLLPRDGFARAEALQWLMFGNASMHPAYSRAFWLLFNKETDVPGRETLQKAAAANINKLWQVVEDRLADRPYLCGDAPTAGDILLTVIANWSKNIPQPITIGPKTREMLGKIIHRSSYQKALSTEQVEYKMAS